MTGPPNFSSFHFGEMASGRKRAAGGKIDLRFISGHAGAAR
jgi:hypothetical protein